MEIKPNLVKIFSDENEQSSDQKCKHGNLVDGHAGCPWCGGLLIHYGSDKFIPEKVLPVKNDNWVKPKKGTGLWTSPIGSKWSWINWNDREYFRYYDDKNYFTIFLKADAKIFVIDSLEDLEKAPLRDGYCNERVLDFELIAKNYDAIWLTEKGQKETHLSYPINLYGWDCETVLILNSDCCIPVS